MRTGGLSQRRRREVFIQCAMLHMAKVFHDKPVAAEGQAIGLAPLVIVAGTARMLLFLGPIQPPRPKVLFR